MNIFLDLFYKIVHILPKWVSIMTDDIWCLYED